jgi:hypothetical protein
MKSFNNEGISIGYIKNEKLRTISHIQELVERLFFTSDMAYKERKIYRELSDADIPEETKEIELNNRIIQAVFDGGIDSGVVYQIINLKTKKAIGSYIYENVSLGKTVLHKKDVKYVKALHEILIKKVNKYSREKKNKL